MKRYRVKTVDVTEQEWKRFGQDGILRLPDDSLVVTIEEINLYASVNECILGWRVIYLEPVEAIE